MPTTTNHYYIVATFKHLLAETKVSMDDIMPHVESFIESLHPIKSSLVILENGVNADNQHLNIVVHACTSRRTDHVRRSFQSFVYLKLKPDYVPTRHDVKVKNVSDEDTLIGGYLQKEDEYTVLHNSGYDLRSYKERCKVRPTPKKKTFITLTPHNAVEVICEYAEENDLPVDTRKEIIDVMTSMASHGYNLVPCMSRMNSILMSVAACNGRTTQFNKYLQDLIATQNDRETQTPMG